MITPRLEFVCRLEVRLAPIKEMGTGRAGQRRIIPITGGQVSGPKISGRVLNLGADWQTIFSDGVAIFAFQDVPGRMFNLEGLMRTLC